MPRRRATITQSEVARAIRAARQSGAAAIEVRKDGTIVVLLNAPPLAPVVPNENDSSWDDVDAIIASGSTDNR
jgi:hypothetical protein